MRRYSLCGQGLDSDLVFPELSTRPGHWATWRLLRGTVGTGSGDVITDRYLSDGTLWMTCSRHREGCSFRFPGLATFLLKEAPREGPRVILVDQVRGIPLSTVRHLFLDHVFPLALAASGEIVLHAATIQCRAGAVALLGPAGSGKSTLAASFGLAGHSVLSDDCLLARTAPNGPHAIPSYPGLRLWPGVTDALGLTDASAGEVAHYSDKRRVRLRFPERLEPVPLRGFYVLEPTRLSGSTDVFSEPLRGSEAFLAILTHTFQVGAFGRHRAGNQLRALVGLAESGRVRKLSFPREYDRLSSVREAVLAEVGHDGMS